MLATDLRWSRSDQMTTIPNLYLKWRAFRTLIGDSRSDADIARLVFDEDEGPIKFSKLLYGDYGCRTEIASELADVINRCISAHRKSIGLDADADRAILSSDFTRPVYDFVRLLIEASGGVDSGRLEEAHNHLITELLPSAGAATDGPRLTIERYDKQRAFAAMKPPEGPLEFEPDRHLGQFSVEGVDRQPEATYAYVVRDAAPVGHHLWEHNWQDTVLWLPSPFRPCRQGSALHIMPEPQSVLPMPGRFHAIVVLAFDAKTAAALDPRGPSATPAQFDEVLTARFVTNVRRLLRRKSSTLQVLSGEYHVVSRAN